MRWVVCERERPNGVHVCPSADHDAIRNAPVLASFVTEYGGCGVGGVPDSLGQQSYFMPVVVRRPGLELVCFLGELRGGGGQSGGPATDNGDSHSEGLTLAGLGKLKHALPIALPRRKTL